MRAPRQRSSGPTPREPDDRLPKVSPAAPTATSSGRRRSDRGRKFVEGRPTSFCTKTASKPPHWRKPRRVFVNSPSDLFTRRFRSSSSRLCSTLRRAPAPVGVLTKRSERLPNSRPTAGEASGRACRSRTPPTSAASPTSARARRRLPLPVEPLLWTDPHRSTGS